MGIPCTILTFTNDDHKSVKRPARAPASDLQAVCVYYEQDFIELRYTERSIYDRDEVYYLMMYGSQ